MRDMEGHKVKLLYNPNRHLVILGGSGYGKTFAANRNVLYRIRDGDSVIIMDISGSYTAEELERSGNVFGNHICYYQADVDEIEFPVCLDDVPGALVDALIEGFGIQSYNQETILTECCEKILEDTGSFTFMKLFQMLGEYQHRCQEEGCNGFPDMLKNVGYLLNKFRSVRKMDNIVFRGHRTCEKTGEQKEAVTILQLSNFSEKQRQVLSVFFLSLLWLNAKCKGKRSDPGKYDAVLIDEFQHFPMTEDSSFAAILREGRKYNFSAIVCSQYLSDRKQSELSCLLQAGTALLFRPAGNEVKLLCKLFGLGEVQTWKRILLGLDVGEAVLVGAYELGNGRVLKKPLIVEIEEDVEPLKVQKHHNSQIELEVPGPEQPQSEVGAPESKRFEKDIISASDIEEILNEAPKKGSGRGTVIYR